MNKRLVQMMVLAIVLFAGFTLDANAQCGCDTNLPTVISGTVKNSSNVPMQNVKVTATDNLNFNSLFAFTDSNGDYVFSSSNTYEPYGYTISSCRAYSIKIEKFGVSPVEITVNTNKTSSSCPDPTATNFTYNRDCGNENSPIIWGYVKDPQGFPLEGVTVYAWHNYGETQSNPRTKTTDENGYYAFHRHNLRIYSGLDFVDGTCREWVVKAVGTQSPPLVHNPLTNDTYDTYEDVNFRIFP